MGVCVVVYLLQVIPGLNATDALLYSPLYSLGEFTADGVPYEPWRMITAMFAHSTGSGGFFGSLPLHLALNMFTLWIFGQVLEPMLGRARFLALYLISIFGGSVGVLLLANPDNWVVGASGAIFGLMAAYFVILRQLGQNSGQMLGLIAINLVFGFFSSGVSWEGHVGGLVTGGVVALVLANTRMLSQQSAQRLGLVGVVLGLVLLTVFRMQVLGI